MASDSHDVGVASHMDAEMESVTIRVPKSLIERVRLLAAREMTQGATIYRRIMRVGIETEEARLDAESASRRAAVS